jgi:hypothetical protein
LRGHIIDSSALPYGKLCGTAVCPFLGSPRPFVYHRYLGIRGCHFGIRPRTKLRSFPPRTRQPELSRPSLGLCFGKADLSRSDPSGHGVRNWNVAAVAIGEGGKGQNRLFLFPGRWRKIAIDISPTYRSHG